MPHLTASAAMQAVIELSPQIPFWPQLPQRSAREVVIAQGLNAAADFIEPRQEGYGYQVRAGKLDSLLDVLHRGDGALTSANASCFAEFQAALSSGRFGSAAAVKGQIEGPVTLSAYLFHRGRPFLADPALFAAVAFHVSQIACWQIDRLRAAGLPVLLFIDEPALCLEGPVANTVSEDTRLSALAATLNDVRMRGALAGLHCCAASPVSRMCCAKPDILSFDAHQGLELFFADRAALDFMRDGGTVAYGLIPTSSIADSIDPAAIFTRWFTAAALAGDPQELARRALVTATCGLGLLNEAQVEYSFRAAHAVGELIGKLAAG